jgi:hypothetical protein
LGKFNLPVTITPTSNTTFFIHPTAGDDTSPGTAAQPWKTVENALKINQPPGLKVATVANAGNDVVVTILSGGTENVGASGINTPALSAGSVTVLQAPFPKTFTLNMGGSQLILNQGYKLQDINIISSATGTAVKIKHPTAGLASVEVKCTGSGVTCVEVMGAGFHTLKDVTVDVTANNSSNVGIRNDAVLSIVGGEVRLTEPTSPQLITLIKSDGVLTATGLTVDMTGGVAGSNTNHTRNSTGIVLNAPGSLVTNSTIKVNKCTLTSGNSIGIDVQHTTGKSTVVGNNFISYGTSTTCPTVGVNGSTKLSPDPSLPNNNFSGAFGNTVQ